jgi:hypothetical protein
MLKQAGVKSIVFGGRPSREPMAAIGGTQGAEVLEFNDIATFAKAAVGSMKKSSTKDQSILKELTREPPIWFDLRGSAVNFADSFFGGEGTTTPLQFQKTKLGSCRVFYTKQDLVAVRNSWERLAKGDYTCIDGGEKW